MDINLKKLGFFLEQYYYRNKIFQFNLKSIDFLEMFLMDLNLNPGKE